MEGNSLIDPWVHPPANQQINRITKGFNLKAALKSMSMVHI